MVFLRSRSVGFLIGLFLLPAVFTTSFVPIVAQAVTLPSGETSQTASLSLGESQTLDFVLEELEVSLSPQYQGAFIGLVLGFIASVLPSIASFVATGAFIPSVLGAILTGGAIGAVQVFGTIGGLVISQAVSTLVDGGEKALQDKIGTTGEVDPDGAIRSVTIVIPGKGCDVYTSIDKLQPGWGDGVPPGGAVDAANPDKLKQQAPEGSKKFLQLFKDSKSAFEDSVFIKTAQAQSGDGGDAASDGSAGAGASGNGTAGSSSTAGDNADASTDGSAGTGANGNSSANGNSASTGESDGAAASSGASGGGAGADGTAGGGDAGDAGGDGVNNDPGSVGRGEVKATKDNPCPIAAAFYTVLKADKQSVPVNQNLTLRWAASPEYKACSGHGGAWPAGLKKFGYPEVNTETFNVGDETGTMWHSFVCVYDQPDLPDGKPGLHFEKIVSYRVDVGIPEGVVYGRNGDRNGDVPPSTKLTGPACAPKCPFNSSITLKADARDEDGVVTLVELWINGAQHSTKAQAPYEFNLGTLKSGKYSIYARARDDGPGNKKSNNVEFEVLPAAPPTVTLAYPPCGSRCSEKENLVFKAEVGSSTSETVTAVDLLVNGKAVIQSKEAPYLFDLDGLKGGVYRVKAVAKAADGQTGQSSELVFTYSGPVQVPALGSGSSSGGSATPPAVTPGSLQSTQPPAIGITAKPSQIQEGQLVTLEWAAERAAYCLAQDDWPKPSVFSRDSKFYKPVSGTQRIYFVNVGAVYTLQCFNLDGKSSKVSVKAEALSASSNDPVTITLKVIK